MSGVYRNIDPPSPPGECVPSRLWCGGRSHLPGGEGWGGGQWWFGRRQTLLCTLYMYVLCGEDNTDVLNHTIFATFMCERGTGLLCVYQHLSYTCKCLLCQLTNQIYSRSRLAFSAAFNLAKFSLLKTCSNAQ